MSFSFTMVMSCNPFYQIVILIKVESRIFNIYPIKMMFFI